MSNIITESEYNENVNKFKAYDHNVLNISKVEMHLPMILP